MGTTTRMTGAPRAVRGSVSDGFPRSSARRGEEGVALMLVLLFILLLSVIVVEFAYEMQVEASLAANTNQDFQAYIAAKSAVASGLGLLRADMMADDIMNTAQNGVAQAQKKYSSQQQPQTQDPEQMFDSLIDVWAQGVPYQALNDDSVMQCTISDEYGKINLNALVTPDGQENEALVEALRSLFANLGFEKDPTDAILDWVDSDDDERPEGAESGSYESLETPYSCKNGQMDSIEELLLIADIPAEVYFDALYFVRGDKMDSTMSLKSSRSGNSSGNSNSKNGQEEEEPETVTLADLLTVHGEPSGAINVNTARPEALEAVLGASGQDNGNAIEAVLQERLNEPFQSVQDFYSRAGVTGANQTGKGTGKGTQAKPTVNTPTPKSSGGPKANTGAGAVAGVGGGIANSGKTVTQPGGGFGAGLPGEGVQGGFTVRSDVFRIFGDGQVGDVMVRIEAYVFRMGYQDQAMMNGGTAADKTGATSGTGANSGKTTGGAKAGGSETGGVASKTSNGKSAGSFGIKNNAMGQSAYESFRILDWRVIR